jgi:hypothetical protein
MAMLSQKSNILYAPLYNNTGECTIDRSAANLQYFKILIVTAALYLFYMLPKTYLGDTYPICLFRIFTGKQCPGCGTTRAVWSILHFKFNEAFAYNKLIIVTFPLLAGCTLSWIFKRPKESA